MKSYINTLVLLGYTALASSCVDRKAMTETTDNGSSAPIILLSQPATANAVPQVIDTLRSGLNQVAEASQGATVPNPHITIVAADGSTTDIVAPKMEGGVFGTASPKARQDRLEAHLKLLADKMSSSCKGQKVPVKLLKASADSIFQDQPFAAWAAGGGASPWTGKEKTSVDFCVDQESFVRSLVAGATNGQRYVIVTDPTEVAKPKVVAAASAAKKPTPSTKAAQPTPKRDEPVSTQTVTSTSTPLDAKVGHSARPGDNISIQVNYPGMKNDETPRPTAPVTTPTSTNGPKLVATTLPDGVEPIGEPILFAASSSKLTAEGKNIVMSVANLLKSQKGGLAMRIFVVGGADSTLDENRNKVLSQDRAEVVRVALWELAVHVEGVIAIGESLSPDNASARDRANDRRVQIYVLRQNVADTVMHTQSPLATK